MQPQGGRTLRDTLRLQQYLLATHVDAGAAFQLAQTSAHLESIRRRADDAPERRRERIIVGMISHTCPLKFVLVFNDLSMDSKGFPGFPCELSGFHWLCIYNMC